MDPVRRCLQSFQHTTYTAWLLTTIAMRNSSAIDGGNCWAAPCGLTAGNAVVYTVYTQTCVLLSKHRVYAGIYIQLLEKHDMNAPSTDISLIGRISKARLAVSSSVTAGLLPQAFVFCPCSKHVYL